MNAQVYAVFDGKTERKDHLKDQGLDGKITENFPLRLSKQDDIKLFGEWSYSSMSSLSRQKLEAGAQLYVPASLHPGR
jgi:hypothetical protein